MCKFLLLVHLLLFCSFLVHAGGSLFEYYILMHGTKADFTAIFDCLEQEGKISDDDINRLILKYAARFWFDTVRTLHDLCKQCIRPMVLWSMMMEYRGLSNVGMEMGSVVRASLPRKAYERHKKKMLQSYDARLLKMVHSNCAILTWDNYSHIYPESGLRLDKTTAYTQAFYTVVGASRLEQVPKDGFPFVDLKNEEVLDSVPASREALAPYLLRVTFLVPCAIHDLFRQ